jgi:hypothetical protein
MQRKHCTTREAARQRNKKEPERATRILENAALNLQLLKQWRPHRPEMSSCCVNNGVPLKAQWKVLLKLRLELTAARVEVDANGKEFK